MTISEFQCIVADMTDITIFLLSLCVLIYKINIFISDTCTVVDIVREANTN